MKRRLTYLSILVFTLLFLLPTAALAQNEEEVDQETIDQDLTLTGDYDIDANTIVNGDVAVLDGELDLAGTVNGDVIVFGGELDLTGTINGDLAVIGGVLVAEDGAVLSGECLVLGGTIDENDAGLPCTAVLPGVIGQELLNDIGAALPEFVPDLPQFEAPIPPEVPELGGREPGFVPPDPPEFEWENGRHTSAGPSFFGTLFEAIGRSILAGFLAFVVAAIYPARLAEVSDALERKPVAAGTIGLLTAVAALSLLTLTSIIWVPLLLVLILLCGIGLILLLAGATFMGGTVVFSWTAVGALVGERLAGWLKLTKPSYATLAALGTAAMTLGVGLLGLLPFTPEVLVGLTIFSIGLGGVVLTRFGRQPYPPLVSMPEVDQIKIQRAIDNMPEE